MCAGRNGRPRRPSCELRVAEDQKGPRLSQIQEFWDGLDGRKRLIGLLSAAAIVAAIFGITRVATTPSMSLLYSGLDPAAAGEVVAELEAEGVAFQIADNRILVDTSQRDRIRMQLAARDLPSNGSAGYEILDGLSGFGTTSQMFDAAYWRAKEGELARTIAGSPDIRAARVHLASPLSQPFARTAIGSASVTVTMARGTLDLSQAKAIRFLVSSAVAGFLPENVAVLDSAAGVVLAGEETGPLATGGQTPDTREETLRASIQRLLEARVGPGRAVVEVSVDADMDSQTISERIIDPDSRIAISTESEQRQEEAEGSNPGVTVASNLPDGDVGASGANTRTSNQSSERQNFEVSETRRERIILPGQVKRISVAVMVDGVEETAADGTTEWTPRAPEEMETLRLLVQSAIGFDAERGDTVTIESLRLTAPLEQGTLAEAGGSGFLEAQGARLAQMGVLGAIVLALILFVLRPMMTRRVSDEAMAELTGPVPALAPYTPDAQDADTGVPALEAPPRTVSKIDRLREVIASRGDDSAAVLRQWIEAPDAPKETVRT